MTAPTPDTEERQRRLAASITGDLTVTITADSIVVRPADGGAAVVFDVTGLRPDDGDPDGGFAPAALRAWVAERMGLISATPPQADRGLLDRIEALPRFAMAEYATDEPYPNPDGWIVSREDVLAALRDTPPAGLDVERLGAAMSEAWDPDEQLVDDSEVWHRFAPRVLARLREQADG